MPKGVGHLHELNKLILKDYQESKNELRSPAFWPVFIIFRKR